MVIERGGGENSDVVDRTVSSAFAPREKLVSVIGDMPAFVVSALVVSLLQHPRGVVAESLSTIVDVLVGKGGDLNTTIASTSTPAIIVAPSQQQVFAHRTGPARVSLSGLCGEPLLMEALLRCLDVDACRQPALMMVKRLMMLEEVRNGVGGMGQLNKVVEKVQKQRIVSITQQGGPDLGGADKIMQLATEVVDLAANLRILFSR